MFNGLLYQPLTHAHKIPMTLQTARSNSINDLDQNEKEREREKEKKLHPSFFEQPYEFVQSRSTSFLLHAVLVEPTFIGNKRLGSISNERVPECARIHEHPLCTIAHQRCKILPGEIALISRRTLFPFYTIIIHHLSDKIDPI